MTKDEARAFKSRWELVNRVTAEETRRTPVEIKLRQLAQMYEAGQALGWAGGLKDGEEEVRERWRRLREFYNAGA